eukprot:540898-Amphidinium_carterae.1
MAMGPKMPIDAASCVATPSIACPSGVVLAVDSLHPCAVHNMPKVICVVHCSHSTRNMCHSSPVAVA